MKIGHKERKRGKIKIVKALSPELTFITKEQLNRRVDREDASPSGEVLAHGSQLAIRMSELTEFGVALRLVLEIRGPTQRRCAVLLTRVVVQGEVLLDI